MTLEITLDAEAHWCRMWLTSAHLLFVCYNPDTNYQGNRPQQLSTATYKSHEKLHLQSLASACRTNCTVDVKYLGLDLRLDLDEITFSFMIPFIDWVYLLYFLTNLKKLPPPSPLSCSLLPSIFSRNACFHVLQLCWKTEKKKEKKGLSHEWSNKSDPQGTTTKHSLTLDEESADLFLLAQKHLFLS